MDNKNKETIESRLAYAEWLLPKLRFAANHDNLQLLQCRLNQAINCIENLICDFKTKSN